MLDHAIPQARHRAAPGTVHLQGDVALGEDWKRMVETAFGEFGDYFTTLVNNAGVAPKERLDILEAGEESVQRLMDINLKGPYFLTREIAARSTIHPCRTPPNGTPEEDARVLRGWLGLS